MRKPVVIALDPPVFLQPLPRWITAGHEDTPEDLSLRTGAALARLDLVQGMTGLPSGLWRDRLALRAAECCLTFSGRPERVPDLRDIVHLLRPGDLPGPAGEVALQWQRAAERTPSVKALQRALIGLEAEQIAAWLDAGQGGAVTRAALVLEAVLRDLPRFEVQALILADTVLAQALGWDRMVPLLAIGLKRLDLRKRGDELRLACCRAVLTAVAEALRLAAELFRRAEALRVVAPKLRAKAAPQAVEVFLARDAVAPSALPLPDRAARRLCDRLVDLGAVRELTGRSSFRLYGV